jgi:hypothetical protein
MASPKPSPKGEDLIDEDDTKKAKKATKRKSFAG